jgi:hypothetical protein
MHGVTAPGSHQFTARPFPVKKRHGRSPLDQTAPHDPFEESSAS